MMSFTEVPDRKTASVRAGFLEEYQRIRTRSAKDFDRKRRKDYPCWTTVCRYHGVSRWCELLGIYGLRAETEEKTGKVPVHVRVSHGCDFTESER